MSSRIITSICFVFLLAACTSDTVTMTEKVATFIKENKLHVDDEGNVYGYAVGGVPSKGYVLVELPRPVLPQAVLLLEEAFGDRVVVQELQGTLEAN